MATFEPKSYEAIVESVLSAMTAPPSPLTDRSVGSVTRTLAESVGREIALLHKQLLKVHLWGFVDTAEAEALDRVVALLGLKRRRQETAAGQAVFYRKPGTVGDITIPAGTRVSTGGDTPVTFETVADVALPEGGETAVAEIRALAAGPEGVVPAGAISYVNRPVAGISAVENSQGTSLGAPTETDAQLRERARRTLERAGKATINAIRYGLMEVPGVESVAVTDDPVNEPGVVKVTVEGPATPAARQRAIDALNDLRAAGIRVRHNLGGADHDPSLDVVLTPIHVACHLTFDPASLPADEQERARKQVDGALRAYLSSLEVEQPVSVNRMIALALAVAGVGNAQITVELVEPNPADGVRAVGQDGQLRAKAAERFTLQHPRDLAVEPSGIPIYLDVSLTATSPESSGLPENQIRTWVQRALEQKLAQVSKPGRGRTASLELPQLEQALQDSRYSVSGVTISTALYTGRGLLLREPRALELVDREVAQLRSLSVTVTGGGSR